MAVFWYEAPCTVSYNELEQRAVVIFICFDKVLLNLRSIHFCLLQLTEPRKGYCRSGGGGEATFWGVPCSEGTDSP